MSEVLSQSEIDALLTAMQSGAVGVKDVKYEEDKRIRTYNFRRPNKFSKDQLNTLEVVYDNFCLLLATLLSGILRTRVTAKVDSVDQMTYEEFTRSLPNPTILNVFSLSPLEGKGILELNPIIGFSMIDRLFGGPGVSTFKGRPLTEIEKNVMEKITEKVLSLFNEAWSSLHPINALLEVIEINPQFTQVVAPSEMIVLIAVNTQIGDTEGLINICLPCLMLEGIAEELNTKFWFANVTNSNSENYSSYLQKTVEKTVIPLSVILGRNTITIKELLELRVGDVIPLEKRISSDVEVYIDSKLKYYAKPGLIGKKMAVQIKQTKTEGGD